MKKHDPKLSDTYRVVGGKDLYAVECLIGGEWEAIYPVLTHAEVKKWLFHHCPGDAEISLPGSIWLHT